MTSRIYKVAIVAYPASWEEHERWEEEVPGLDVVMPWAPDGWEPDARYLEIFPDGIFRWPKTSHLYRSRSAAVARAALIESYGATAIVLEADLEWVDSHEAAARRRAARDQERAARLRAKAADLLLTAETLDPTEL